MKPYIEFLGDKVRFESTYGHRAEPSAIHPVLKPHQRDIVQWAVEGGRRAIFAAFGLGKSVMQLEILTVDELAALSPEQLSRIFTEQTLRQVYDYESHVRIGEHLDAKGVLPATFMSLAPGSWSPEVWHDVNRMLTLNTTQSQRAQQMHVCPLQFDIVDRLIGRFSNPGDLVYDPFAGLMTVPVRALKLGRRGRGVELNLGYYFDGVKYLEAEERSHDMPSLFDLEVGA